MPTHPLQPGHRDWPNVERAWQVYSDMGGAMGAVQAAAEAVGRPQRTVSDWIRRYKQFNAQDPAILDSMNRVGTGLIPALAWAKTKTAKDGTQRTDYSVLLKPDPLPDDTLDRIKAAFEGMAPAEPVAPPPRVMADLMAVWPVMDLHMGMHAWAPETGDVDYDTKRAAHDLREATEAVLAWTPATEEGVLILGGDTLHADTDEAVTHKSRHPLDVDGRHFRTVDRCIEAIAYMVERLLSSCQRLTVRVLRGNHDEHSHMILTFALAERYRENPRVNVEKSPRDLFMMQWGRTMIAAHHGDKGNPQRMAMQLADVCPYWSATRHRYAFTGHVHHDQAKDVGGLRWESLRAFCPPDAYAASMGFTARRALQAVFFDKQRGLVLRAMDPVERAA